MLVPTSLACSGCDRLGRAAARRFALSKGRNDMIAWARTADGWALNLDGSDAAATFSLPRLEMRSSAQGWKGACLLADGRVRELAAGSTGSLRAALAGVVAQAQRMLGPTEAAALMAARS